MSADRSTFEGGCLCGAIRYRATAAPVRGVICHCKMCQRHSGAPFLSFVHFPVAQFEWLGPEPTRFRSSEFAQRGFCPDCGSTLTMHEEVLSERVQIAVGSLDEPDRVRIDDQIWTESQVAWIDLNSDLPRYAKSSPSAPTKAKQ